MSYSYHDNRSTLEKDRLIDGNEFRQWSEAHGQATQHHDSPKNVGLTPTRRRHDENENDVQEI